jgi:hypothetical protein
MIGERARNDRDFTHTVKHSQPRRRMYLAVFRIKPPGWLELAAMTP